MIYQWPSDRRWTKTSFALQFAFRISMFNVSCNSHYLSHFAASFIDVWAEWSTAKNFSNVFILTIIQVNSSYTVVWQKHTITYKQFQISSSHANIALASQLCSPIAPKCISKTNNDPSAGSPTETLLRLLLPLNDQVWSSSKYAR